MIACVNCASIPTVDMIFGDCHDANRINQPHYERRDDGEEERQRADKRMRVVWKELPSRKERMPALWHSQCSEEQKEEGCQEESYEWPQESSSRR